MGSDDEDDDARPQAAKGSLGISGGESKRTTGDHDVVFYSVPDGRQGGDGYADDYRLLDPDKPHPGNVQARDAIVMEAKTSDAQPPASDAREPKGRFDIVARPSKGGFHIEAGPNTAPARDNQDPRGDQWRIDPGARRIIEEASEARRAEAALAPSAPKNAFGFSIRAGSDGIDADGIDVHEIPIGVIPDEEPRVNVNGSSLVIRAPNGAATIRIPNAATVANDHDAVEKALSSLSRVAEHTRRTLEAKNSHFLRRVLLVLDAQTKELTTRQKQMTSPPPISTSEPAVALAEAAPPTVESTEPPSTALVSASNAASIHPYRGHQKTIDQGTHPVVSKILDEGQGLVLSDRSLARVNELCASLVEHDTHPPMLDGIARVAIAVERDVFLPTELMEETENLYASWRIEGIPPEVAEQVNALLIRARKKLDQSYTLGLRAWGLLPVILAIMYLAGAPPIALGVLTLVYGTGLAAGQQTMHLVNHRRKELDEMRAPLQLLLPPLKHRDRIKALSDGGKK